MLHAQGRTPPQHRSSRTSLLNASSDRALSLSAPFFFHKKKEEFVYDTSPRSIRENKKLTENIG